MFTVIHYGISYVRPKFECHTSSYNGDTELTILYYLHLNKSCAMFLFTMVMVKYKCESSVSNTFFINEHKETLIFLVIVTFNFVMHLVCFTPHSIC